VLAVRYSEGMTNNEINEAIYHLRTGAARRAGHQINADTDISFGELGNPDHDWSASIDEDNTVVVWAAGRVVASQVVPGAYEATR